MAKVLLISFLVCILLPSVSSHAEEKLIDISAHRDAILNVGQDISAAINYLKGVDQSVSMDFARNALELIYVSDNVQIMLLIRNTASRDDAFKDNSVKNEILREAKIGIDQSIKRMEGVIESINVNLNFAQNQNIITLGNQLKTKIRELISRLKSI